MLTVHSLAKLAVSIFLTFFPQKQVSFPHVLTGVAVVEASAAVMILPVNQRYAVSILSSTGF